MPEETDIYFDEKEASGSPVDGFTGEKCYDCQKTSNQLFWHGGGYWCNNCGAYNRYGKMKKLYFRPDYGAGVMDLLIGYVIPRMDVDSAF